MSVDLGWAPLPATIHLSAAGDFTFTFTTEDTSDWPAGTAVTVVFDDTDVTSWPATRSGPDLSWNVDKVAVAALLQRGTFTASIRYSDGVGVDVEWMRARVVTGTGAVPQSQIVATLPSAPTVIVLPVATAGGGGGSGTVVSIGQGAHITVDATDPASPVVGVTPGAFDAAGAADAAQTAAIAGAATYTDGEITAEVSRANAAYDAAGAAAAEATARAAADALLIPLTQKATANGVATLDSNGTVPSAQIPALALTATVVVSSQAAMLALTTAQVQPGDLAVRTDGAGTFILTATDPSVLSNWTRLNAPTDAVVSVNGQTGTVTLGPTDVGADATGAASAAQTAAAADATTKANAAQAFAIQRGNHTGTQSADTIVDGTTNKVLTAADKTRLANTSGTNTGDQDLSALAPKASPALTGVPTVPTAPPGTNSTQAASTAYADAAAAAASVGLLDYRGTYNASGNTFPASGGSGSAGAVVKGDFWIVATPGTLGGTAVANGDLVIALTDTPGQAAGNWDLIEHDVGYAPENVANKSTATALGTSDTLYPSQKAVKAYVDAETTRATTAEGLLAPLASPALTGNPTAPTQTPANNSTRVATTAYADAAATAAAATKAAALTRQAKTANYTAVLGDMVVCDTTGGTFTVTLPAASGGKGRIDVKWVAGTVPPSIAVTGSDHIDTSTGSTGGSFVLLNQAVQYESDGTSIWVITASNYALSTLDSRYSPAGASSYVGPWYGNGSDGDVTIAASTNISQDMYYHNLTINPGQVLSSNGYRIFVSGTLTLNGTLGSAGAAGGATGSAGATWTNPGTIGRGYTGGAGGTAAGSAGTGQGFDMCSQGGAGGAGSGGAGGAAGSFGAVAASRGGPQWAANIATAALGSPVTGGTSNTIESGGSGGGGGGGDGTAGGGGGGGGGVLFVAAKTLAGTGTLDVSGGAGGSPAAGNRGGGGGGGGGYIIFIAGSATNPYTINVSGGAAGTKSGTGVNGTAGSNGKSFVFLGA